ncbi:RcpC/CpaB family pilus assembly protein [Vibrio lentus]|nr:RcpC/CpaB family pilus assembly protein [Vibrio lentus]
MQPGYRAISVPVDQVTSNSGFIEPGDRVDILLLGSQDGELPLWQFISRIVRYNDSMMQESWHLMTSKWQSLIKRPVNLINIKSCP